MWTCSLQASESALPIRSAKVPCIRWVYQNWSASIAAVLSLNVKIQRNLVLTQHFSEGIFCWGPDMAGCAHALWTSWFCGNLTARWSATDAHFFNRKWSESFEAFTWERCSDFSPLTLLRIWYRASSHISWLPDPLSGSLLGTQSWFHESPGSSITFIAAIAVKGEKFTYNFTSIYILTYCQSLFCFCLCWVGGAFWLLQLVWLLLAVLTFGLPALVALFWFYVGISWLCWGRIISR